MKYLDLVREAEKEAFRHSMSIEAILEDEALSDKLESFRKKLALGGIEVSTYDLESELLEDTLSSQMLRAHVAKDPSKQGVYASVFRGLVEKITPWVQVDRVLNKHGVLTPRSVRSPGDSRPVSLYLSNKNLYVWHFMTNGDGGAQDRVFGQVLTLLQNIRESSFRNYACVLDGDFWTLTRITTLTALVGRPCFISNTDSFLEMLGDL